MLILIMLKIITILTLILTMPKTMFLILITAITMDQMFPIIYHITAWDQKCNQVENFMAYVNQQKFCPNIYNSASSFWCRFLKKYGNGLLGKFCCTSCYYYTCEEIYCGNNNDGEYKLCKLSQNDIKNLRNYYDSHDSRF